MPRQTETTPEEKIAELEARIARLEARPQVIEHTCYSTELETFRDRVRQAINDRDGRPILC